MQKKPHLCGPIVAEPNPPEPAPRRGFPVRRGSRSAESGIDVMLFSHRRIRRLPAHAAAAGRRRNRSQNLTL
jgi:hypothetical protein